MIKKYYKSLRTIKKQFVVFNIFFKLLFLNKKLNLFLKNFGIPIKNDVTIKDLMIYSNILYYYDRQKFDYILKQFN